MAAMAVFNGAVVKELDLNSSTGALGLYNNSGALIGRAGPVARQLVKVERVQLELHGVADGAEAHGIAEVAGGDYFQIAAAQEAFSVGNGEPGGQLEAAPAAPRVAHLRAADFVLFQDASAFGTS
jgi:hypothetical protein